MRKIRRFFIVVIILLGLPNSVQALGLGAPVLNSHLNEILDVRVPLLLAEGESLNSIFIEFAKPKEYRLVGLEPYTDLSGMRISVEHTQHGGLYIFLSSVSVVQAPIVSLLFKARIGHNTYYKQVQLLLDTMELGAGEHAVKARPKSLSPRLNGMTSKVTPDVEEEHGWARTWRYGPVRSGDSLSTIAYRLRRDKEWSNHDVMLALYRFNANAFIDHDMNRLKSGVWLEIPREKMLKELLKQTPAPYENLKRKPPLSSKKLAKPMLEPETATPKVKKDDVASQLRYVGHISLGNDEPSRPLDEKVSSGKSSVQLQQQLDQLYRQAMDDHLQMASLDQNLTAIRDDIGKLSSDIAALKEQQNAMQQQAKNSPNTSYWMLGFLLLCLLNIILIGAFLYHRYSLKKKEKYDIEEAYFRKKVNEPAPIEEPKTTPVTKKVRKKHLLENKIFDLENYLNLRDYEAAENILKQLNKNELNHIGICALHARLYHETERLDELDALIRNKKSVLNNREWSLLCDRLHINIWHALHESGVLKDNGALLNDKDSLIYDANDQEDSGEGLLKEQEAVRKLKLDATVIMNAPNLTPLFEDDSEDYEPVQEDSSLSTLTSEVVDMEDDFLELNDVDLNDVDLEDVNSEAVESLPDDDFTSTVFTTTLDSQKES